MAGLKHRSRSCAGLDRLRAGAEDCDEWSRPHGCLLALRAAQSLDYLELWRRVGLDWRRASWRANFPEAELMAAETKRCLPSICSLLSSACVRPGGKSACVVEVDLHAASDWLDTGCLSLTLSFGFTHLAMRPLTKDGAQFFIFALAGHRLEQHVADKSHPSSSSATSDDSPISSRASSFCQVRATALSHAVHCSSLGPRRHTDPALASRPGRIGARRDSVVSACSTNLCVPEDDLAESAALCAHEASLAYQLDLALARICEDADFASEAESSPLKQSLQAYVPFWRQASLPLAHAPCAPRVEARSAAGAAQASHSSPTVSLSRWLKHARPKIGLLTACVFPQPDGSLVCKRVRAVRSTGKVAAEGTYFHTTALARTAPLSEGSHAFVRCIGERFLRVSTAAAKFGHAAGHVHLSAEGPVLYAGEIEVDARGELARWNNMSGSYRPSVENAHLAMLPEAKLWCLVDPAAAVASSEGQPVVAAALLPRRPARTDLVVGETAVTALLAEHDVVLTGTCDCDMALVRRTSWVSALQKVCSESSSRRASSSSRIPRAELSHA